MWILEILDSFRKFDQLLSNTHGSWVNLNELNGAISGRHSSFWIEFFKFQEYLWRNWILGRIPGFSDICMQMSYREMGRMSGENNRILKMKTKPNIFIRVRSEFESGSNMKRFWTGLETEKSGVCWGEIGNFVFRYNCIYGAQTRMSSKKIYAEIKIHFFNEKK